MDSAAGAAGPLVLALRRRADLDFLAPPAEREPGRHTADLPGLGLRVSITRARYPNRDDGRDLYAVTVSRLVVGAPPDQDAVRSMLVAAFGAAAVHAEPRPGGQAVSMFRVPAAAVEEP